MIRCTPRWITTRSLVSGPVRPLPVVSISTAVASAAAGHRPADPVDHLTRAAGVVELVPGLGQKGPTGAVLVRRGHRGEAPTR
jgi:hypothetical protein